MLFPIPREEPVMIATLFMIYPCFENSAVRRIVDLRETDSLNRTIIAQLQAKDKPSHGEGLLCVLQVRPPERSWGRCLILLSGTDLCQRLCRRLNRGILR
ncbi:hypothetical protein SDC9_186455 [bioreactor metagenome]|uniref:Uncharacterized protein n=1 Tax=bioreactor metagenome TaxID=1076179 RepID=A0A645HJK7_9ZZZZ